MANRATLEPQLADCTSVADYAALIDQALADPADRAFAEELAEQADGLAVEVEDAVAMAGIRRALGADDATVRGLLEEAEVDCQFTRQFVALARGFHEYCGDDAKMRELMEQAEEFCMTDEEQIDLGDGIHSLLGDSTRAAACYQKGLASVQDKEAMLALAEKFAGPINDAELARTVYARAEEKMSTGSELCRLARSVREHLNDTAYAEEIYRRAGESLTAGHELMTLAADCSAAGLAELSGQIYDKVLDTVTESNKALELLAPLKEAGADAARLGRVLDRARALASESADLLDIARQAQEVGADTEVVHAALADAEDQVTSLGELNNVIEAIHALAADDTEWHGRLEQKLEKRKANQARYTEFQDREKLIERPFELVRLADQVMAEIEDAFYAKKLLTDATTMLAERRADAHMSSVLACAIDRHLNDAEWVQSLLTEAAEAATDFATVRALAHTACTELSDSTKGREWARAWYTHYQQTSNAAGWDLLRLGRAVLEHLGDSDWAVRAAESAAEGGEALLIAQAGLLARAAGNNERAGALFTAALQADATPRTAISISQLLRREQVDADTVRELYRAACPSEDGAKLVWAEGILEVFQDAAWAQSAYAELDGVTDESLRQRIAHSRNVRFARELVR